MSVKGAWHFNNQLDYTPTSCSRSWWMGGNFALNEGWEYFQYFCLSSSLFSLLVLPRSNSFLFYFFFTFPLSSSRPPSFLVSWDHLYGRRFCCQGGASSFRFSSLWQFRLPCSQYFQLTRILETQIVLTLTVMRNSWLLIRPIWHLVRAWRDVWYDL